MRRDENELSTPALCVVTGQHVTPEMVARAKALRHRMTEEERLLWGYLKGNLFHGLHFRRQQIIGEDIVDFYCHGTGVVVEVDGEIHRQRRAADAERDERLRARGLVVIRVTNAEVRDQLEQVLARIEHACQGRGTRGA